MVAIWRTSRIVDARGRLSFSDSGAIQSQPSAPTSPLTNPLNRERSTSLTWMPLVPPTKDQTSRAVKAALKKHRAQTTRRYALRRWTIWKIASIWLKKFKESVLDLFTTHRSLHLAALKPRIQLFREVMRDEVGTCSVCRPHTNILISCATLRYWRSSA